MLTACRVPRPPQNGRMMEPPESQPHANYRYVFSMVGFTCDNELTLVGMRNVTCMPNGRWSGPTPQCKGIACVKSTCDPLEASETEFHKRIDTMKSKYYRSNQIFC